MGNDQYSGYREMEESLTAAFKDFPTVQFTSNLPRGIVSITFYFENDRTSYDIRSSNYGSFFNIVKNDNTLLNSMASKEKVIQYVAKLYHEYMSKKQII